MSTVDPAHGARSAEPYAAGGEVRDYTQEYSGSGWVLFAGTMLAILATLNFIDGVAAVSNSTFFTEGSPPRRGCASSRSDDAPGRAEGDHR